MTVEQASAMRRAFAVLIDRDFIIDTVTQRGEKEANCFIPDSMSDGNGGFFKTDAVEEGYFDPYAINNDYEGTVAKAIELLEAAGYKFENGVLSSETPISIEYLTNESTGHIAVAESMQQDFAAVGIEMTIQVQDWNVFLEERKAGHFDFAREGWIADFNDPINMLEMWTTVSGNNDCQYGRYEGWNA
jgi:peptide/nickel transport system substrate-binding protein/oligopeptide transport system substrate-binding protein